MEKNIAFPGISNALKNLAYNLYFSWNPDVRDLFRELDDDLWISSGRNPVAVLQQLDPAKLKNLENNTDYVLRLHKAYQRFSDYLNQTKTRFNSEHQQLNNHLIAYFSAEYGINEALPNYAGGLGVLAGDHCKTASDLGLPFVAVGLMYKHAYFTQQIDEAGNQTERYEKLNPKTLPLKLVLDIKNNPILVSVPIADREVFIQIWEVQVGRIILYLLDTNVDNNSEQDRNIIHSLYGGSRDTRIQQEIILGIGGVRALKKMGLQPTVFHMNEGHSAFLGLERLVDYIDDGLAYNSAMSMVQSSSLFTTHTPIPAGNETFEFEMMETYFADYWQKLGLTKNQFFSLGRNKNIHEHENFSLTILALNLSSMANGVSQLHGDVSRHMWQKVFPGIPTDEVPIGHVTNGIHTESWLHREMIKLFDSYLGPDWRANIQNVDFWKKVYDIPDEIFWQTMLKMKADMSAHLKGQYQERLHRYQNPDHGYPPTDFVFDDSILTIGFARRFAPYKRATLMFKDPERLKRILNNPERPVQILFAGKAHPHNDAGKELIRKVNEFSKLDGFKGKIVFIEGYTINTSRSMIAGVDVWLNTPRRPLEASGTSGQKVHINGGVNFSILDGWWPEGYNGRNGWIIGTEIEHPDHNQQDDMDSQSFYNTLEQEIIPAFYDRDKNGIPSKWLAVAKESLVSLLTPFSTHTMVWNYTQKYYVPGMRRVNHYQNNDNAELFKFSRWLSRMQRHWKKVSIALLEGDPLSEDNRIFGAGESREISVQVNVDGLKPEDLRVELILERQDAIHGHQQMEIYPMGIVNKMDSETFEYKAHVKARTDGSYRFNCRIIPTHADLYNLHETRLIKWLD